MSEESGNIKPNICHLCQKRFKTITGLEYHLDKKVCLKKTRMPQGARADPAAGPQTTNPNPTTKRIVPILPRTAPATALATAPATAATAPAIAAPTSATDSAGASAATISSPAVKKVVVPVPTEYQPKKLTIEEIVANQLDPSQKTLLYVEKGCQHKVNLDPQRFDSLRYLSVSTEDHADVPFDDIMEKTDYLLKDPYFWIRWRDITTH